MNSKYYTRKGVEDQLNRMRREQGLAALGVKTFDSMSDYLLLQNIDWRLKEFNCFRLSLEELEMELH